MGYSMPWVCSGSKQSKNLIEPYSEGLKLCAPRGNETKFPELTDFRRSR